MLTEESVPSLMAAFRAGDSEAGSKLIEIFYPELKRLAASQLRRERQDHSWHPTLLVNELYLQFMKIKGLKQAETAYDDDRSAFFALAGLLMRRLLIHHSRFASSKTEKVPLEGNPDWGALQKDPEKELAEVEMLLRKLEDIDPVTRTVVEMKVFEGYTAEEIALKLDCSAVTIYRHWQFAKHWLSKKL